MSAQSKLSRLPLLPLGGLLLVVLTVVGALLILLSQQDANRWVQHSMKVQLQIGNVEQLVRKVESSQRGYLITQNPDLFADMSDGIMDLEIAFGQARAEMLDNPRQLKLMDRLKPLIDRKIALAEDLVDRRKRNLPQPLQKPGTGRQLMEVIDAYIARLKGNEQALLQKRTVRSARLVQSLAIGQSLALLLALAVAAALVRDSRRRSEAMEEARDEALQVGASLKQEMAAREEAEAQLRQIQKMESIGQLTGGIAHDFNNMLAIIIGSLDLAGRRINDPEKIAKCIDNARDGAERAAALTSRLLAFSRQQPLAPIALNVNKLVSGMSELLRRTLGEQIEVETVLSGGLWTTFIDPGQLENAVLNLAVNARDAIQAKGTESGKLTIETANSYLDDDYVRARGGDITPGQYVMICVTDTGAGMSANTINRAFDPFFTTKEVGKGTGLGLSQVFGFVKQSGGHIAIYSETGEGTTIRLYLPRHHAPEANLPHSYQDQDDLPEGSADEIILVVEDEQRVRHFSVDSLRELGYTALSAESPSQALRLLRETPGISLIFTDIVMPEMNGRRLADEARLIMPDVPILYTTGYTRNAVVHNGMLDAGVAFLQKPFTLAQLAWKVRFVLDSHQSSD
jgi:signal transduction histidine kinase